MSYIQNNEGDQVWNHRVVLRNFHIENLSDDFIARHTAAGVWYDSQAFRNITPISLSINAGAFTSQYSSLAFPDVTVVKHEDEMQLSCSCYAEDGKLCEHQAQVLTAIMKREELAVFFDEGVRLDRIRKVAADYGLQDEKDLDRFFKVVCENKRLVITPYSSSLLPVNPSAMSSLGELVNMSREEAVPKTGDTGDHRVIVIFRKHRYYTSLLIELFTAAVTQDGKIKNPLSAVSPLDLVWQTANPAELKFFAAVGKFQGRTDAETSASDLTALRVIVQNSPGYDFYFLNNSSSASVTARSVQPVNVAVLKDSLHLEVKYDESFYRVSGHIKVGEAVFSIKEADFRFGYFLSVNNCLYLVDNLQVLGVIGLLKKKNGEILVHSSKFSEFRSGFLSKLEDVVRINYSDILPATPGQLKQGGFYQQQEWIIYLSDFGQHVMIIPVIRYGEAEIPVRTKRQIFATDKQGKEFAVQRNARSEDAFTALLIRQHADIEEQLQNDLYYFYLHKKVFLDEAWFPDVFEEWQSQGITVLGFNELEGNKLSPYKVNINIRVLSGLNWFNALVNVKFGKKRASLKQLLKAVKNKHKYVQLDDGTKGILPAEWIEKFSAYFNAGEVVDDENIRIPKVNYQSVSRLFDDEMLENEVKDELKLLHEQLSSFDTIKDVPVPADFNGTLRKYQKQGLNWLNFLDDMAFGGCLADDMGLGKSIQVIAFLLSLRAKAKRNGSLIVVPASLIFNWQAEIARFAPSLSMLTIYGSDRIKAADHFDRYEVILTSYGTMLSDIAHLRHYEFNYVFLDESQAIKNPDSQRYKAARLLKSRNKIVITGTPLENNTFDLYGQLSFACPGLLGSKQYFRDIYSIPVDRFQDTKRARELQKRIQPFILRRTKQQVASELPEKTEMIVYCPMKADQRRVYDAYEKEFRDYISATSNEEIAKSPMNVLRGLTRLRQICNSPLLIKGEKPEGESSAKIEALLEQIETKSAAHKILVFSQFVSMLDLIRQELITRDIKFVSLTGSTRNREAVVNSFQNDKEVRVFLISLKAGGTGLNLTEADYVYLVEPWWNPAVENQAIDRSHRIGQDKKVVAVRLITPGTVEEKMVKLQETKRSLAENLVRSETSFFTSLGKDDLLRLLS